MGRKDGEREDGGERKKLPSRRKRRRGGTLMFFGRTVTKFRCGASTAIQQLPRSPSPLLLPTPGSSSVFQRRNLDASARLALGLAGPVAHFSPFPSGSATPSPSRAPFSRRLASVRLHGLRFASPGRISSTRTALLPEAAYLERSAPPTIRHQPISSSPPLTALSSARNFHPV
ncbi:hypothetical protein BO78DRAFT_69578 [Aspergillus sclerotiicarbonarius CBS 121057]|uniref:Uncharacterized protein n=1 Tax=Aspergillus sclerotiicarbonarius (strain CBS 121057 / IBT 28362) TaxID=1448318 RepID=A0A319EPJ9_ASPSB|nr:hypothetical protein BO78DRAFT_69578 [Aspergillus sclerotiicarbonarius CBS 121057]